MKTYTIAVTRTTVNHEVGITSQESHCLKIEASSYEIADAFANVLATHMREQENDEEEYKGEKIVYAGYVKAESK